MPAPTFYIETSVWGSLAPRQPRDRKQIVRRLLKRLDGVQGSCVISDAVEDEIDLAPAKSVLSIRRYLDSMIVVVHRTNDAVLRLAQAYLDAAVLPERRFADALHVAAATCFEVDFLVSWNHRHMTRPRKRLEFQAVNQLNGKMRTPTDLQSLGGDP